MYSTRRLELRFSPRQVAAAALALMLIGSCSDDPTSPARTYTLAFEDDFSSDLGWTDETDGRFVRQGGVLECWIDRSEVQKMYVPISPYHGDFEMEFDFRFDWGGGLWLEIGLAQELSGALNDPVNDAIGAFVQLGRFGEYGGCYVVPLARYRTQKAYRANFDAYDYQTFIEYSAGSWCHAKMEVVGRYWRLTLAERETGVKIGQKTGTFPAAFGLHKYIYIGNPDDEDWPQGRVSVDNLRFSNEVEWENPCPAPCATPPADPMPVPDGLIFPQELYFDEPFVLSWDNVWTGCGGYELWFDCNTGLMTFDIVGGSETTITVPRPGCEVRTNCMLILRSYWGGTCDDRVYSESFYWPIILTTREADLPHMTFTWSEGDSATGAPSDTLGPYEVPADTLLRICFIVQAGCYPSNIAGYRWRWDDEPWAIDWTPFVGPPTRGCLHREFGPGAHRLVLEVVSSVGTVFAYIVEFEATSG